MNKKLFWLVPVLVLGFAVFPQTHSWEDEGGYSRPLPGFWYKDEVFQEFLDGEQIHAFNGREVEATYRGQLISFQRFLGCYDTDSPPRGGNCNNIAVLEMGWHPQSYEETVFLFLARWGVGDIVVEVHYSPAYGDNPERDGPVGAYYSSTKFTDQVDGEWQWYRVTRLFLTGSIAEAREGCEEIYLLNNLENGRFRFSTGCPIYASEHEL